MGYSRIVRAIYDYTATDTDELSFKQDDLLCTLCPPAETPADWIFVHPLHSQSDNDGEIVTGLIPANYVEDPEAIHTLQALYEYAAGESNEISFSEGEFVDLIAMVDEDWWLVKRRNGGTDGDNEMGLVPSNYVEIVGNNDLFADDDQQRENGTEIEAQSHEQTLQTLKQRFPKHKVLQKLPIHLPTMHKKSKAILIKDENEDEKVYLCIVEGSKKIVLHSFCIAEDVGRIGDGGCLYSSSPPSSLLFKLEYAESVKGKTRIEFERMIREYIPFLPIATAALEEKKVTLGEDVEGADANNIDTAFSGEENEDKFKDAHDFNEDYESKIVEDEQIVDKIDDVDRNDEIDCDKECESPVESIEEKDTRPKRCLFAAYSHTASNSTELTVSKGTRLLILDDCLEDWWKVQIISSENEPSEAYGDGMTGYFPAAYTCEYIDDVFTDGDGSENDCASEALDSNNNHNDDSNHYDYKDAEERISDEQSVDGKETDDDEGKVSVEQSVSKDIVSPPIAPPLPLTRPTTRPRSPIHLEEEIYNADKEEIGGHHTNSTKQVNEGKVNNRLHADSVPKLPPRYLSSHHKRSPDMNKAQKNDRALRPSMIPAPHLQNKQENDHKRSMVPKTQEQTTIEKPPSPSSLFISQLKEKPVIDNSGLEHKTNKSADNKNAVSKKNLERQTNGIIIDKKGNISLPSTRLETTKDSLNNSDKPLNPHRTEVKNKEIPAPKNVNQTPSTPNNPWASVKLRKNSQDNSRIGAPNDSLHTGINDGSIINKNKQEITHKLQRALPAKPKNNNDGNNSQNNLPQRQRQWSDKSAAFTTLATFVSLRAGIVKLKKSNGKMVDVALDLLCEGDRAYVRSLDKRNGRGNSSDGNNKKDNSRGNNNMGKPVDPRNVEKWNNFLSTCCIHPQRTGPLSLTLAQTHEPTIDHLSTLSLARLQESVPELSGEEALLIIQLVNRLRVERLEIISGSPLLMQTLSKSNVLQPTPRANEQKTQPSLSSIPAIAPINTLKDIQFQSQPLTQQYSQMHYFAGERNDGHDRGFQQPPAPINYPHHYGQQYTNTTFTRQSSVSTNPNNAYGNQNNAGINTYGNQGNGYYQPQQQPQKYGNSHRKDKYSALNQLTTSNTAKAYHPQQQPHYNNSYPNYQFNNNPLYHHPQQQQQQFSQYAQPNIAPSLPNFNNNQNYPNNNGTHNNTNRMISPSANYPPPPQQKQQDHNNGNYYNNNGNNYY